MKKAGVSLAAVGLLFSITAGAQGPAAPPATTTPPPLSGAPGVTTVGNTAVLTRGGHAHLANGAALRVRSEPDAQTREGIGADALLTLKVSLKKDSGVWWFATSDQGSGWALETELQAAE